MPGSAAVAAAGRREGRMAGPAAMAAVAAAGRREGRMPGPAVAAAAARREGQLPGLATCPTEPAPDKTDPVNSLAE